VAVAATAFDAGLRRARQLSKHANKGYDPLQAQAVQSGTRKRQRANGCYPDVLMPTQPVPPRQPPPNPVPALLRLVSALREDTEFDVTLHRLCTAVAELLDVERVSVRLLDETRRRLLLAARSSPVGQQHHGSEFDVGEGLVGWVLAHREALRLADADSDPRFVVKPGQRAVFGSFLGLPVLDDHGCIGVLSTATVAAPPFNAQDEERARLAVGIMERSLQVGRLRRLTTLDPLTSAYNRRALEQFVPSNEDEAPLSAAMLDLDHFKQVNDRHGHPIGDLVLRGVVATLHALLRQEDRVLRMGGEEFLILLPGARLAAAAAVTERARLRIAAQEFAPGVHVTFSAGVVERARGETREAFVARADQACYQAKSSGRNVLIVDER
jgi:diguanylate cyclase (GGDEF)-like protein